MSHSKVRNEARLWSRFLPRMPVSGTGMCFCKEIETVSLKPEKRLIRDVGLLARR